MNTFSDNIKKENEDIINQFDQQKSNEFFAKCEKINKKIPKLQTLWNKLAKIQGVVKEEDPIFAKVTSTIKSILNKTALAEKEDTHVEVDEEVSVNNSMN